MKWLAVMLAFAVVLLTATASTPLLKYPTVKGANTGALGGPTAKGATVGNAGVDVSLTQDILSNPIVGLPDMGAYEVQ